MDEITRRTLIILGTMFVVAFLGILAIELRRRRSEAKSVQVPEKRLNELWLRYLSWVVIAPVFLIPAHFGKPLFNILVMLVAAWNLMEFFGLTRMRQVDVYRWEGRLFALAVLLLTFFDGHDAYARRIFYNVLPIFIMMTVIITPIVMRYTTDAVRQISITILGILYFGWMFAHLIFMRDRLGFGAIVFVTSLIALSDVLAYTVGRVLGRRKLIPEISPGKTVEGALGSIIGTAALALLFSYTLPWLSYPFVVLLGVIISITGQLGDLVISVIKRDIGVKDASRLIPGHGGLLDRTDSLIFTVPIAYFYLIGLCGC